MLVQRLSFGQRIPQTRERAPELLSIATRGKFGFLQEALRWWDQFLKGEDVDRQGCEGLAARWLASAVEAAGLTYMAVGRPGAHRDR